ncbi:MAG: DNA-binding protein [Anaeroplasmataceae bacterium]|nr:DNA-binding protein [Anaeroplasmataceae bacterium]
MTLEKREEVINLYDVYQDLLTDKQKSYFEEYYFDDLSIGEIAENHTVSRNAVFDQLKRVIGILKDYEAKLKLVEKTSQIEDMDLPSSAKEKILDILKG